MSDRDQVLREREKAEKAWWAGWFAPHTGRSEAELAAYLDREHPLPEPEPRKATVTLGNEWSLHLRDGFAELRLNGSFILNLPQRDLPAIGNLLCPFEEVARALADELSDQGTIYMPRFEFPNFVRDHLPAILARLSRG
jgi:hypothetical protein